MKEIISLHVGGAGINIGNAAWSAFCGEHGVTTSGEFTQGIDADRIGTPTVLFEELPQGNVCARAVFVDSDGMDSPQRYLSKSGLVGSANYVQGKRGSAGHWSAGELQREVIDKCLEVIRHEVEKCSSMAAIQITHATAGGTGSGLFSTLLGRLSVDYGKKSKLTLTLIPSREGTIADYNTVLTIPDLLEHADMCVLVENKSIDRVCAQTMIAPPLSCSHTQNAQRNDMIASVLSSLTAATRLPGKTSPISVETFLTNLAPYPRIHFLLASVAGVFSERLAPRQPKACLPQILSEMYGETARSRYLCCVPPNGHRVMATCPVFRGGPCRFSPQSIVLAARSLFGAAILRRKTPAFRGCDFTSHNVEWSPTAILPLCVDSPRWHTPHLPHVAQTAVNYMNTFEARHIWEQLASSFDASYAKRAFVHWHVGDGRPDGELPQAREELAALAKDFEIWDDVDDDAGCE